MCSCNVTHAVYIHFGVNNITFYGFRVPNSIVILVFSTDSRLVGLEMGLQYFDQFLKSKVCCSVTIPKAKQYLRLNKQPLYIYRHLGTPKPRITISPWTRTSMSINLTPPPPLQISPSLRHTSQGHYPTLELLVMIFQIILQIPASYISKYGTIVIWYYRFGRQKHDTCSS